MSAAADRDASRTPPAHRRIEVWETGFTGIRTFAGVEYLTVAEEVDAAIIGVPFDGAASFRPGARFGPEAIRAASGTLRGYHPAFEVDVFEDLSVVDWGDLDILPANTERTAAEVARTIAELAKREVAPVVLGGDHSIALGEVAGLSAALGPMAVVLLDAHADTLQQEEEGQPFSHGTWLRRAVEQGVVVPERSVLAGMRGPVLDAAELEWPRQAGFEVISCDELRDLGPKRFSKRVRKRVGEAPAHLSVDIDVVDPAFAPGTGTPEVGGLASHELLAFVRSLTDLDIRGFDVVEVSPPYDNAGQTTALLAANVVYDFLALTTLSWNEDEEE
jgi:agmatinase